jgi:hypothetical protein
MIYHLSDSPDIKRFEPRGPACVNSGVREPVIASSLQFSIFRMRNA